MKFSLIVCTYKRPKSIIRLLDSVFIQDLYPDEILVIDGSDDNFTKEALIIKNYAQLRYFKVDERERGLTKQRNFGIRKIAKYSELICFLDDDIELTENYFSNLLETYKVFPDAIGVGGYILNDVGWQKGKTLEFNEYGFDGWRRPLGSRNVLRKKFHLLSDKPPGYMPEFSNGFSTGFLPPSGKTYPVEYFMGGVASYKKELFEKVTFSPYFEGYGLYEDMDFCLRASVFGQLYVNTAARLYHFHEESGRPNKFAYGKMVICNGWYVWRVKYPKPKLFARIKWHSIAILLIIIRLSNVLTDKEKMDAFTESLGRIAGWWQLLLRK